MTDTLGMTTKFTASLAVLALLLLPKLQSVCVEMSAPRKKKAP